MKFDGNMAGRRDSQNEVHDLFEKLVSWRDESHKHISGIINSHNNTLKLKVCNFSTLIAAILIRKTLTLLSPVFQFPGDAPLPALPARHRLLPGPRGQDGRPRPGPQLPPRVAPARRRLLRRFHVLRRRQPAVQETLPRQFDSQTFQRV